MVECSCCGKNVADHKIVRALGITQVTLVCKECVERINDYANRVKLMNLDDARPRPRSNIDLQIDELEDLRIEERRNEF